MATQTAASQSIPQESGVRSPTSWPKRFAVAGFLFFLCKGLIWLAVLAAAWRLH